jgi:hypothetical protein
LNEFIGSLAAYQRNAIKTLKLQYCYFENCAKFSCSYKEAFADLVGLEKIIIAAKSRSAPEKRKIVSSDVMKGVSARAGKKHVEVILLEIIAKEGPTV